MGISIPIIESKFVSPGTVLLINGMAFTNAADQLGKLMADQAAAVSALASVLVTFGEGMEWKDDTIDGSALCRS